MEYRKPQELKPHPISVELYGDNDIADIKESIDKLGILVPLTITDKNIVISGHRRWRCAIELGIASVPIEVKTFADELAEKKAILDYNKQREKTVIQKINEGELLKEIFTEEAKRNRESTSKYAPRNDKGQLQPVRMVSSEPVNTMKIVGERIGLSEDKYRKVQKIWNKSKEGDKQSQQLMKEIDAGEKTIGGAFKELQSYEVERQLKQTRSELAKAGETIPQSERWHVEVADINTFNTNVKFDYIITDPPYPKEFLPLYEVLAERANDWLKPTGLLIAMCGQSYLDQIYEILSKHLKYYWTAAYLTPKQPTPLRQRQVNSTWKPILIYSPNDDYKGKIFGDVYISDKPEKDNHEWGQSVSGMLSIISQICLPGQTIFDPFLGSGSTGVAALQHGCLFHGIDVDEQNVNISKKRLAEVE